MLVSLFIQSEMLEGLLHDYYIVGGMPEVISRYLQSNSYTEARQVQEEILFNYQSDFISHLDPRIIAKELDGYTGFKGAFAEQYVLQQLISVSSHDFVAYVSTFL